MQRVYCYVDESGQDTTARESKVRTVFIIGIVFLKGEQSELERICMQYEKLSGKGTTPWHKSKYTRRLDYLRRIVGDRRFKGVLCYKVFQSPSKTFFDMYTMQGIACALGTEYADAWIIKEIFVDGLTRSKRSQYSVELRRMGIQRASVHRATDQGNPLIRLADALAGLVRDADEKNASEAANVLRQGKSNRVIFEV